MKKEEPIEKGWIESIISREHRNTMKITNPLLNTMNNELILQQKRNTQISE